MNPSNLYGLIGYPLEHSFSARFFNDKFRAENIDARYDNFELASIDRLPALLQSQPTLQGLNVTSPYKRDVIPYLETLDPVAKVVGAVNTIRIDRSKAGDIRLHGFNTDVGGFAEAVKPLLAGKDSERALVLGTGGAASAVVAALDLMGIGHDVVSRRAGTCCLTYDQLTPAVVDSHRLIVNATPLGMWPHVDAAPDLPYDLIGGRHVCFDLIYNPPETLFMKLCSCQGATVANGYDMLLGQARLAWKIFGCRS